MTPEGAAPEKPTNEHPPGAKPGSTGLSWPPPVGAVGAGVGGGVGGGVPSTANAGEVTAKDALTDRSDSIFFMTCLDAMLEK